MLLHLLWASAAFAQGMPANHPSNPHMDWQVPAAVLMAGLLAGFLLLSRQKQTDERIEQESRRIDLASTHDEVLEALKQLETEQAKMDPAEYKAEREALLARGARAMAVLDGADDPAHPASPAAAYGAPAPLEAHADSSQATFLGILLMAGGVLAIAFGLYGASQTDSSSAAKGGFRIAAAGAAALLTGGGMLLRAGRASAAPPPQMTQAPSAPSQAPSAPPPPAPAPAPASGLAPEWRGALYALAAVGLIGGFVWFAQQGSKPRVGDMGMTGGDLVNSNAAQPGPAGQSAQFQQSVDMLKKRLEANPDDIDAMNGLTELYFTHQDPASAMEWNDKALEKDPKNADARVYRAVLSAMMSLYDRAVEQLDEVVAEQPDHPKAVVYRGLILMEMQRFDEAVRDLERAVELQNGSPVLQQALDQARALARGEVPPPMQPPAASGDLIVSGSITLGPGLTLNGSETIFVSVADPARPGPPIAADKLPAGPFPLAFDLTTADIRAMPGAGGVPAVMDLKVRVDLDGNAMTREGAEVVSSGVASGVQVVLTPGGGPQPAPAPAATGAVLVSGTAKLGAGATFTGAETVFISVRDPAGGPPLAADKRVGVTFPMPFQITDAQILDMGGGPRPVPEKLQVSVRLDKDGNAMTMEGDPSATLDVAKGATGLDLTLQ